jgi:hypothetical protein
MVVVHNIVDVTHSVQSGLARDVADHAVYHEDVVSNNESGVHYRVL